MRFNKFIISILLILVINGGLVYSAYWCAYKWMITECMKAQWNSKSIEDFLCIEWNITEVTYQVILDTEFKLIDEEVDKYLKDLEDNKNYYFWVARVKTYIDAVNEIETKRRYFKKKYFSLCWDSLITKAWACFDKEQVASSESIEAFKWSACSWLVENKLEIFDRVSYSILLMNKMNVLNDYKKIYDQWQRKNFDMYSEIINVNLEHINAIAKKWSKKLQNAKEKH